MQIFEVDFFRSVICLFMSFLPFRGLGGGLPFRVLSKTSIIFETWFLWFLTVRTAKVCHSVGMKQGEFIPNFKNLEVQLSFASSIQASLTQGHLTVICPACTTVIKPEPTCLNGPPFFTSQTSAKAAQKGSVFLSEISLIPLHSNQTWNIFKL